MAVLGRDAGVVHSACQRNDRDYKMVGDGAPEPSLRRISGYQRQRVQAEAGPCGCRRAADLDAGVRRGLWGTGRKMPGVGATSGLDGWVSCLVSTSPITCGRADSTTAEASMRKSLQSGFLPIRSSRLGLRPDFTRARTSRPAPIYILDLGLPSLLALPRAGSSRTRGSRGPLQDTWDGGWTF